MALIYKKTDEGSLRIRKLVIGQIVVTAVNKFSGRVKITNAKGKVIKIREKYGIPDATDHIEISLGDKGLDVRFFVAIRFGLSIGLVTEQLISDIKEEIEKITAVEANSIAVVVTGLIAKQITPRNIEVKKKNK